MFPIIVILLLLFCYLIKGFSIFFLFIFFHFILFSNIIHINTIIQETFFSNLLSIFSFYFRLITNLLCLVANSISLRKVAFLKYIRKSKRLLSSNSFYKLNFVNSNIKLKLLIKLINFTDFNKILKLFDISLNKFNSMSDIFLKCK